MMDPAQITPVDSTELLGRFVTQSSQFRKDYTVKQDLFMPNLKGEVSVMRHRQASEDDIWNIGDGIASKMNRTLYGRSDVLAVKCQDLNLSVNASPTQDNPNHADIINWPDQKEDKKAIAQKLAAAASKLVGRIEPNDRASNYEFQQ
jgi:hypothetical protein